MSLRGFEKSEVIHNIYSFFKNWIATPLARNDNFNYTYKLKNNFASLNNNVAVAHCAHLQKYAIRKSAQGVTTPCYKKRIATPLARNDNENNFIIPNLVKTILTSINFDSLSRKIKSPCLTIKKFISKGVCNMKHTKNILKSLLITVMALSLLAVSCKKDEGGSKPTDPTPKNSKTLLTEKLKSLGQLKGTGVDKDIVMVDLSNINPQKGKATISKANKQYTKVKAALAGVLTVDNFKGEQIGLTAAPTISDTKPNPASAALSVKLTFKANTGYTFDTSITEGDAYTYDKSQGTAELTLEITPATDWE